MPSDDEIEKNFPDSSLRELFKTALRKALAFDPVEHTYLDRLLSLVLKQRVHETRYEQIAVKFIAKAGENPVHA